MSAYRVWGKLNKDQSNAILYPTWYSGKHWDNDWLIGPGMGLDPSKYCIIVPNMFGNGLSSSPSNTPPPANAARFPEVSLTSCSRHCCSLYNIMFGSLTMQLSSRHPVCVAIVPKKRLQLEPCNVTYITRSTTTDYQCLPCSETQAAHSYQRKPCLIKHDCSQCRSGFRTM